jgi:hypothetical protein
LSERGIRAPQGRADRFVEEDGIAEIIPKNGRRHPLAIDFLLFASRGESFSNDQIGPCEFRLMRRAGVFPTLARGEGGSARGVNSLGCETGGGLDCFSVAPLCLSKVEMVRWDESAPLPGYARFRVESKGRNGGPVAL